jgi:hypothetical protein
MGIGAGANIFYYQNTISGSYVLNVGLLVGHLAFLFYQMLYII